jgi:hypothetical protein
MKYVVLNGYVVCVNEIRDAYIKLGDIYIDFKSGTTETLKIPYYNLKERNQDFLELCEALKELSDGGTTNGTMVR